MKGETRPLIVKFVDRRGPIQKIRHVPEQMGPGQYGILSFIPHPTKCTLILEDTDKMLSITNVSLAHQVELVHNKPCLSATSNDKKVGKQQNHC